MIGGDGSTSLFLCNEPLLRQLVRRGDSYTHENALVQLERVCFFMQ